MKLHDYPSEFSEKKYVTSLFEDVRGFWGEVEFHPQQRQDRPNKYRIAVGPDDTRIASIWYKRDNRTIEGLAHELLHLELYRLGYPVFETTQNGISRKFVSQANNSLQHQVMLPMFIGLGLEETRFESERPEFSDYELEILAHIKRFGPYEGLENYTTNCLKFFKGQGIEVCKVRYRKRDQGGVQCLLDASPAE
jgi:hypothetical protein